MDKVFIPVNLDNVHWCLAVIYMQEQRIQYYDSMNGKGRSCMEALKQYLKDEMMHKKKQVLDTSTWTCLPTQPNTPQQQNGIDCGVFSTMCAHFISTNSVRIILDTHYSSFYN